MMKKGIYAILAALAVFALVMTGCPGTDTPGTGGGTPATVTITFNLNGGKIGSSTADVVKSDISTSAAFPTSQLPANPTKDGDSSGTYLFDGWSRGASDTTTIIVASTTFTEDTTLYAQYTTVPTGSIAIKYNDNFDGAADVPVIIQTATTIATLRTPATRGTGITFAGWFTENTFKNEVTTSTTLSGNVNLYAKWTIKITFTEDTKPTGMTTTTVVPSPVDLTLPFDNNGVALRSKLKAIKLDATELKYRFDAYYQGSTIVTTTTLFTSDTTITGKIVEDDRLIIRFKFNDDATSPDVIIRLDEGQSFEAAGKRLPYAQTKTGYVFANWVDENGDKVTLESSYIVDTELTQAWYKNSLTSDGELEKLSLDNAGLAIYKFALGSTKLDDYKEFRVTYKVTEAALKASTTRNRVYGNFGTFATQADTTNADRFDATTIDGYQTDSRGTRLLNAPKFNVGDYIVPTGGGRDLGWDATGIVNNIIDPTTGEVIADASITEDTWFTLKYPIGELSTDTNSAFYKDLTGNLYFALGFTTNGSGGRDGDGRPDVTNNAFPIVQLVKDIVLVPKTGSTNITATIPSNTEASFMAYAAPKDVVWCWRGANATAIPDPAPVAPPDYPVAIEDFTVKGSDLDLVLFQNDEGKSGTDQARKRVIISGDTITFDLRTNDYNSGGEFGGGGFSILFEDLGLPELDDDAGNPVADYRSYSKITLTFDIVSTSTDPDYDLTGYQIIFSAVNPSGGGDVTGVNGQSGNPGQYVGIQPGTDVSYWFSTDKLNVGASGAGVAVRANNYSSTNVPIQCTIKVKSITFNK
jgi:uncharacterized repeat protein (TIGR02543 family)